MKTTFFQSISGNQSSSRLIGFIVIMYSMVLATIVLFLGKGDVLSAAAASGTLFITMAGTAMGFLFAQKKTEQKQETP